MEVSGFKVTSADFDFICDDCPAASLTEELSRLQNYQDSEEFAKAALEICALAMQKGNCGGPELDSQQYTPYGQVGPLEWKRKYVPIMLCGNPNVSGTLILAQNAHRLDFDIYLETSRSDSNELEPS